MRFHCRHLATTAAFGLATAGAVSAQGQDCVQPPSGLIGWWGTELGAADGAGHNDGQLINGARVVPGLVGKALLFGGVNDRVAVPDNPAWDFPGGDFTIEFWTNLRTVKDGYLPYNRLGTVFVCHSDGYSGQWLMHHSESQLGFFVYSPATGQQDLLVPCPLSPNQWTHLALTRSGSRFTFYKDATVLGAATSTLSLIDVNASLDLGSGSVAGSSGAALDGYLDEVSIYGRALSATEIGAIFAAGNAGKCGPPIPPLPPTYTWESELVYATAGLFCETAQPGWLSFDANDNATAALENYNPCGGPPAQQWGRRTGGVWSIYNATAAGDQGDPAPMKFAVAPGGAMMGLMHGRQDDAYLQYTFLYPLNPLPGPRFAVRYDGSHLFCDGDTGFSKLLADPNGNWHVLEFNNPCDCRPARTYYDSVGLMPALGYSEDRVGVRGVGGGAVDMAFSPDGTANIFMTLGVPCNQQTSNDPEGLYLVRAANGGFTPLHLVLPPPHWSHMNVAIDQRTGMMHMAAINTEGPGGTRTLYYLSSVDNGQTWSNPRLISGNASNPDVAISVAPDGRPGIAYWLASGNMRYAEPMCDGTWISYNALDDSAYTNSDWVCSLKLAYDSQNRPSILFYHYPSQQWRLLRGTIGGVAMANAGPDQTVPEGTVVTLDGSASIGPGNAAPRLTWTQIAGPAVTLNTANPAHPTFASPAVGHTGAVLRFRLEVANGSCGAASDFVDVNVTDVNSPPVADAGADHIVSEGTPVVLDGSLSSDPDNDVLSYAWAQTGGPPVVLDLTDPLHPSFYAPAVGREGTALSFRLVVSDGLETSQPDTVNVSVANVNLPPIADAGVDQAAPETSLITLDGSASLDPDGDTLIFLWSQVAGTDVALDLTDQEYPTFTAPSVARGGETITFSLVVWDGLDFSDPDTVNVTVANVNHAPVAVAKPDQIVAEGAPVALNGALSYDVDDDPLAYTWIQTGGAFVSLNTSDPLHPTFTAPYVGHAGDVLTFRLEISDGLASSTDDAIVVVEDFNHAPVANAGSDQTRLEGSSVGLDGSASIDPDGDALFFSWQQVSGPSVVLANAGSATPSFVAPHVASTATLVFRVTADDGYGGSSSDTVAITVRGGNAPPVCDTARPSVAQLWPPNHKLVPVTIVGVTDPDNNQVTITITGVTQDEPVNGLGDGDTAPDAVIQGSTVLLRAERSGTGNGRVYRLSFTADDGNGGTCSGVVRVGVPHDLGKGSVPIEDAAVYNSLGN